MNSCIAFNRGGYDPSSAEGQHELAHVRQQTGGAVSMLPQEGELAIDPDERLEREAEETAEQVMRGGTIGVQRMRKSEVHVQRLGGVVSSVKNMASLAKGMRDTEKAQQQNRADEFESMGQTEGKLEERVSSLEEQVSQLGDYVSEQVAPSDMFDGGFMDAVGREGTKEGLKIAGTGLVATLLSMKTQDPAAAVAGATVAQSGVETMWRAGDHTQALRDAATPDIDSDKLGDVRDTISDLIDEQIRERFFGDDTGDYPGDN